MEKYQANYHGKIFTIEAQEFKDEKNKNIIWYYLYAWNEKSIEHDYLQDNLEMAKQCAFDEFNIPFDCWQQINT